MSNVMQPAALRHALENLNLSQAALSRFLAVNDRTVRQWLSGRARIPGPVALLVRYMMASGTSAQDVLRAVYPSQAAPNPEWEKAAP